MSVRGDSSTQLCIIPVLQLTCSPKPPYICHMKDCLILDHTKWIFPNISRRLFNSILNHHSTASITPMILNSLFVHVGPPRYRLVIFITALNTTTSTLTNAQLDSIDDETNDVTIYNRDLFQNLTFTGRIISQQWDSASSSKHSWGWYNWCVCLCSSHQ